VEAVLDLVDPGVRGCSLGPPGVFRCAAADRPGLSPGRPGLVGYQLFQWRIWSIGSLQAGLNSVPLV
jgi:hypothetical protein